MHPVPLCHLNEFYCQKSSLCCRNRELICALLCCHLICSIHSSSSFHTLLLYLFFSRWVRSWKSITQSRSAHSRPWGFRRHEGGSVRHRGRSRSSSDSVGWERAKTERGGRADGSHDGQRWHILQTRSWGTALPPLTPITDESLRKNS